MCWTKEDNAHLQPANWGIGGGGQAGIMQETRAVITDQNKEEEQEEEEEYNLEMLLVQVHSFRSDYSQVENTHREGEPDLLDPEVWIADTGATTHSMAHPDHGICP